MSVWQRFVELLPLVLGLLVFRITPFAIWSAFASRCTWPTRLSSGLGFCALLTIFFFFGGDWPEFLVPLLALAYHAGLSAVLYLAPPKLRSGAITKDVLFGSLVLTCLILPAVVVDGPFRLVPLVYGFELLFAGYSYVVDVAFADERHELSFRDCLFFLLVDPTLVFSQRSRLVAAGPDLKAAGWRIAAALPTLVAKYAITAALLALPNITMGADLLKVTDAQSYGRFWLGMSALSLECYLAHSSVASVQIGLMMVLGYATPERYRFPLLARDPLDFWRRWNTYTSGWMRVYVFQPFSVHLRRKARIQSKNAIRALSVVATFVAAGAIHELMLFAQTFVLSGLVVVGFALQSLIVLAWLPIESLARRVAKTTGIDPQRSLVRGVVALAVNQLLMQLALVTAWFVLSGLAGKGLPESLRLLASARR